MNLQPVSTSTLLSRSISRVICDLYALAIHPIGHTTMSWNRMSKVFNVESPLETRGKESAEWSDQRGESCHHEAVDLEWSIVERRDVAELRYGSATTRIQPTENQTHHRGNDLLDRGGQLELSPYKDGVGLANDIRKDVGAEITCWAGHVRESHKEGSPLIRQLSSRTWTKGKIELTASENNRVQKKAPMNPSTVFLGDSLINGVRPNAFPQTYAMTSLQMTSDAGTKNQIRPSRILLTIKWLETTTMNRLMWTQQNRANCCRRCCRLRLATNPTKPKYMSTCHREFLSRGCRCTYRQCRA